MVLLVVGRQISAGIMSVDIIPYIPVDYNAISALDFWVGFVFAAVAGALAAGGLPKNAKFRKNHLHICEK